MELTKMTIKARCDLGLCKNTAVYAISPAHAKAHLPWRREAGGVYVCRECLEKLYAAIGKEIIPKSPDSLIKKAEKRREGNDK